jgi:hypothetical protein
VWLSPFFGIRWNNGVLPAEALIDFSYASDIVSPIAIIFYPILQPIFPDVFQNLHFLKTVLLCSTTSSIPYVRFIDK